MSEREQRAEWDSNRTWSRRARKEGRFWCWGCDRAVIGRCEKCPVCQYRANRNYSTTMDKYDTTARSGFTLIELLIVIAIIAMLLALLLPALSNARESARQVQCQSNLRQIDYAARMYADDTGLLPRGSGGAAMEYRELAPWDVPLWYAVAPGLGYPNDETQYATADVYHDPSYDAPNVGIHYVTNATIGVDGRTTNTHQAAHDPELIRFTQRIYVTEYTSSRPKQRGAHGPDPYAYGAIFDVWDEAEITGVDRNGVARPGQRIAPRRHRGGGNALTFNHAVAWWRAEEIEAFRNWDDGIGVRVNL